MKLQIALCEARTKRKWTLQEAADKIGIAKSYLCELESGKMKNPSLEVLQSAVRVYKFNNKTICEIIKS